jgi:hypothetical protein
MKGTQDPIGHAFDLALGFPHAKLRRRAASQSARSRRLGAHRFAAARQDRLRTRAGPGGPDAGRFVRAAGDRRDAGSASRVRANRLAALRRGVAFSGALPEGEPGALGRCSFAAASRQGAETAIGDDVARGVAGSLAR